MRTGLAAGLVALGFLVAGCGQQSVAPVLDSALATTAPAAVMGSSGGSPAAVPSPTTAAPATPSPSPVVTTPPTSAPPRSPVTAPDAGCKTGVIMVTDSDNGGTLCVHEGTDVVVMLASGGGIRATGPLAPRPELVPKLEPGVTGAAFLATGPGVARIMSVLAPCGYGPGIHCMLLMLYHVTLNIVAPAS